MNISTDKSLIGFKRNSVRFFLILLVSTLPILLTVLFLSHTGLGQITDYVPGVPNDTVGYWHYILTFSEVGFNGGYYSPDESITPIDFIRFDVHGPMFPIIYGSVARLIGWQPYTGTIINLVFLSSTLFAFMFVARLDHIQIIVLGILVGSYWPLQLTLPIIMQETFHYSMSLLIAAIIACLLLQPNINKKVVVVFAIFIFIVSLVRFSWALIYVPVLILALRPLNWKRLIWAFLISATLTTAILLTFRWITPPGFNTILDTLALFQQSFQSGWVAMLKAFQKNWDAYLVILNMYGGYNVEAHASILLILLVFLALGGLLLTLILRSSNVVLRYELVFHLLNLVPFTFLVFILYAAFNFYRILSIPIFLSILILLIRRRWWLIAVIIIMNLYFSNAFLQTYARYGSEYHLDHNQLETWRQDFRQYIAFDPAAVNPWCNTLYIPIELYDSRLTTLPAGIGINWSHRPVNQQYPLKSRYLLFDDAKDGGRFDTLRDRLNVQLLGRLSIGDLYLNLDAACP